MAAPDGTLLGYTNNRHPDRVKKFFADSMAKFRPAKTKALHIETEDARFVLRPPIGGLVIRVQAKVLSGYEPTDDRFKQIFQSAISRDALWTTAAEHQQIAAGTFPERLTTRIARHCLVDNTRGEAPAWAKANIVSANITIKNNTLIGHCEMKLPDGSRSYSADLLGELTVQNGQVTKFNMVAKGPYFGKGPFTPHAPKGKFPLAVSFTLADGTNIADTLPPEGARGWLKDYLR